MIQRLKHHLMAKSRAKKIREFISLTGDGKDSTILDVGAADKEYSPYDNPLEKIYAYPAKITNFRKEIEEKNNELTQFECKLSTIPDKISILDILQGKPMSRSDLEKKKLYDLMQFMAFHSRERLVKIFRDCYDDHRDIKQGLDMITTRAGYVVCRAWPGC